MVCHRCDGPLILIARVPHTLNGADGQSLDGTRGIGLCQACDSTDPDAQGVLAFFTLHSHVGDEQVQEAAALITEWARRVQQRPRPDAPRMSEAEYRFWLDDL